MTSDRGSNFTSKKNIVREDVATWNWPSVAEEEAKSKTEWVFTPSSAQFRNGMVERRVALLKKLLRQLLTNSILNRSGPDVDYSQLQGILAHIACMANDRPINMKLVNEEFLVPITVNMLLMGGHANVPPADTDVTEETGGYELATKFVVDVERLWWKQWRIQAISNMLPFHSRADAQRHKNIQEGDLVCWLRDGKISAKYMLALVIEAKKSERDGAVRTIKVQFIPRNILNKKTREYPVGKLEGKDLAVQSVFLVATREEIDNAFTSGMSRTEVEEKKMNHSDGNYEGAQV